MSLRTIVLTAFLLIPTLRSDALVAQSTPNSDGVHPALAPTPFVDPSDKSASLVRKMAAASSRASKNLSTSEATTEAGLTMAVFGGNKDLLKAAREVGPLVDAKRIFFYTSADQNAEVMFFYDGNRIAEDARVATSEGVRDAALCFHIVIMSVEKRLDHRLCRYDRRVK